MSRNRHSLCTYLEHLTQLFFYRLVHFVDPRLDRLPSRNVQVRRRVMGVREKSDEFVLLDLIERLITCHNPLGQKCLKFFLVPSPENTSVYVRYEDQRRNQEISPPV